MSERFKKDRIVAHGPSTRVVRLTSGERVSFAPEALHDMVRQAREGFIAMNVEHLNMFPPMGRWSDGEVATLDDGEQQLLLCGETLDQFTASSEIVDPFRGDADDGTAPEVIEVSLGVESRNFDPQAWDEVAADCPVPVKQVHKWSSLPPIEWVLTIPVAWGAAKFMGSFLERLGAAAGDGLVEWLKKTSHRAHEPERDRYVTLSFELDDGRIVYGFIPFVADDDEMDEVKAALAAGGTLAEVAGRLNDGFATNAHLVAYLFDGSEWNLAWFVTDDGTYSTRYFSEHMPDPERFLGRPPWPGFSGPEPQSPPEA